MADTRRMIAVAIGVSSAEGLPFLPGATNSARRFHEWAVAVGYESRLITDDKVAVTVGRLRSEFDVLFADQRPIHRCIVYFAGHGLLRELEWGWWLLSDWKKESVVVAYESMRRRIASFGVKQIAIVSDACRSLPDSIFQLGLEERAVVGPGSVQGKADLDKFIATHDGKPAYALPGPSEKDDICVFSGVLLEALWGTKPSAFSPIAANCITSSSLRAYLEDQVPLVARRYGVTLDPSVVAAFPEMDNVYLRANQLTRAPPTFKWPLPAGSDVVPEPARVEGTGSVGPMFRTGRAAGDSSSPAFLTQGARVRLVSRLLLRLRNQRLPSGFEAGSGFAVEGAAIRQLWAPQHVRAAPHGERGWWRVWDSASMFRLSDATPLLIELHNDTCIAATALPDFTAGIVVDERGASAIVYRLANSSVGARAAEHALDALEQGGLRADAVTDLAASIRIEKHADPMLGVFAAHLYESIGDIDSIRRMAYFYVKNGQPIPFDIALLAQIPVERDGTKLIGSVPPVSERVPRSDLERGFDWSFQKTYATEGPIGGSWPWLRQGWSYLSDMSGEPSALVPRRLSKISHQLLPSRFPMFKLEHAKQLATIFGLEPTAR